MHKNISFSDLRLPSRHPRHWVPEWRWVQGPQWWVASPNAHPWLPCFLGLSPSLFQVFPGITCLPKTACTQFFVSVSAPGGTQAQTVPSRARTGVQQVRAQNVRKQCQPALGGPWEQYLLKFSLLVPCLLAPVLTLLNSPSLHLPLISVCFFTLGLILSFCRETFTFTSCWEKWSPTHADLFSYSTSLMRGWEQAFHLWFHGRIMNGWAWVTQPLLGPKHQSSWAWPKWLAQPGHMPISEGEWGTIIIDSLHGVGEVFFKGKRCYCDKKGDQKACWTVKTNSYYSPLWFSIPFPFYRWVN